ncbi:MAG: methyltransferase domain-containing protein [Magnetococcales bacterium]|nr:methyltransferase domain-containing protein [Magnetococcales bacterium]
MTTTTSTVRMPGLSQQEFRRLASFIESRCGIQMPDSKKTMVTARLQKRLRVLKMQSFSDYVDWVLDPHRAGDELIHFIDMVTTNKTDFFREPNHFVFMADDAIPDLIKRSGAGVKRPLQVWSAPCSTGEEPYTMAMVILEFAAKNPKFNLKAQILGTDLSTRALKKGQNAVYEMERVAPVTLAMKKKYMLKSKDRNNPLVRMAPALRAMVRFQQINFMDDTYAISQKMDIVFCRNMLIYFDRPTTEKVVNKICRHINPGGYLFVGHSETLKDIKVPVVQVRPTIYQMPEK